MVAFGGNQHLCMQRQSFLASSVYAGQHPKPQHWVPKAKGKPYTLTDGLCFFQSRVHSVILKLRSLSPDVYFETTLPNPTTYDVRFSIVQQWLHNVLKSKVIALDNFTQYSHCQVVQMLRLKFLLIKAFTTVLTKHIVCSCVGFSD